MVILNKNNANNNLRLDRFEEMLVEHKVAKDIFSGTSFDLENTISVKERAAMILEIE